MTFDESIRRLAEVIQPREAIEQQQAMRRAVGPDGRVTPEGLHGLRQLTALQWTPGETGRKRAPRAGTAVVLAAHCTTPPSSGPATVTMTQMSAAGAGPSAVLTIPQGVAIAEVAIAVPVRAGAWLATSVTTANGASGVSTSTVIESQA